MEENNFENAAKKIMESEEAIKEAKAEAEAAINEAEADTESALNESADAVSAETADMKSAADEIVENAAASVESTATANAESENAANAESETAEAEELKPEIRLDDSTQVIDVDYISVDNDVKAANENLDDTAHIDVVDAESVSTDTETGFDPDATTGFDVRNPQYEEHEQSYRDSNNARPVYGGGSGSSYGLSGSYGYGAAAQTKNPGFVRKSTFVIVLIIAMLVTMLASVGITTAYTTYLNNKAMSTMSKSDDHATNYTLTQSDETLSYKSIIDKADDSVVSITTESVTNDIWMQNYVTQGAGSGVIIQSDGYIITCEHVIEGARKITVTTKDGKEYDAEIIGADAGNDIAVIKIDATGLQAATYGDSSKLEVGDATVVIGNPLGTLSGTVTTGIISALDRQITIEGRTMTLLQTDASINPGNSGGGMFDASGNLIGIVEAKSTGSDIDGLGFATPINKAAEIAKNLIENGGSTGSEYGSEATSGDPKIGIMVTEVDDSIAKQYGYASGGLLVRSVTSTQASLAGLTQGDIIYKADGKKVTTQSDLTDILHNKKAGDKLKLSIARDDGTTEDVTTVLVSELDSNR